MKKMLTTIMSVVMMLMVADVRLTANAAEVAEITVESVADDVNGDLEVNSKDVETIIDDLINNPNTQYCVADWVRVSKIVEEKIGPAICGYDISKMDVNPKNNEFILNELASASDLKVKMDENGVTFTRSEENATEVFKFDNCETNPSSDINFFGRFTAVDSMGKTRFFELGSIDGHYVLSKGLSAPIKKDPIESDTVPSCSTKIVIRTDSLSEELDGMLVEFKVSIWGEFWYGGKRFERIEIPAKVVVGGEDWISQEITFEEAPFYTIEEVTNEEDMYVNTMLECVTGLHNSEVSGQLLTLPRNDIAVMVG